LCNKATRPEHLVANLAEVGALVVVDADEDGAVGGEQVARQHEPGVDHRAPVGVEAAVGVGVGDETAAVLVEVGARRVVLLVRLGEVVIVDEVVSRVVGRYRAFGSCLGFSLFAFVFVFVRGDQSKPHGLRR
jgi:hypothetical protein